MIAKILIFTLAVGSCLSLPIDDRVVNGTDADEGEFPYIISLRSASSGSHSCGGSILNPEWILTAAHCVSRSTPTSSNIQYGVTEISNSGPNIAKIADVIIHSGYNPSDNYVNDIALLRLAEPLVFNEFVQAIKLPPQCKELPHETSSRLVGWGLNGSSGLIQKHLQKVDLITFSDEECSRRHNGRTYKTHLCSGVPEGGKGQCNGDSGGPLTVDGEQVGIVSWSVKPCTIAPYPGVYTKVSHYVDWIKENSGL